MWTTGSYWSYLPLSIALVLIYVYVNAHAVESYMDEIFHVTQTQTFARGDWFTWDDKITTFPGTYIVNVGLYHLSRWILVILAPVLRAMSDMPFLSSIIDLKCTTQFIRATNILFSLVCFYYLNKLIGQKKPTTTSTLLSLWTFVYPVFFFFIFLAYTDVLSVTFTVISLYYAHEAGAAKSTPYLSALFAACAVSVRQTNIVWAGFAMAVYCSESINAPAPAPPPVPAPAPASAPSSRPSSASRPHHYLLAPSRAQQQQQQHEQEQERAPSPQSPPPSPSVASQLRRLSAFLLSPAALRLSPFIALCAAFLVFLAANGAIVVGDKSNHVAAVHAAQLVIALAATSLLVLPIYAIYNPPKNQQKLLITALMLSVPLLIVAHGIQPHPFLLADNRHFTFYAWRLLQRLRIHIPVPTVVANVYVNVMTMIFPGFAVSPSTATASGIVLTFLPLLLPVSILAAATVAALPSLLAAHPLLTPAWLLCTAAAVVPAPLVEPRYYLTAAVVAAAEAARAVVAREGGCSEGNGKGKGDVGSSEGRYRRRCMLALCIAAAAAVDAALVWMFVARPFVWGDGTVARFMF